MYLAHISPWWVIASGAWADSRVSFIENVDSHATIDGVTLLRTKDSVVCLQIGETKIAV